MSTVSTTYRPGVVEVTAPGVYRLSELRDEAAQRFADELERPVDWPTLVGVTEAREGRYTACYVLPDSAPPSARADRTHVLEGATA